MADLLEERDVTRFSKRGLAAALALGGVGLVAAPGLAAETTGVFDVSVGKVCWVERDTYSAATWTVTFHDGEDIPTNAGRIRC